MVAEAGLATPPVKLNEEARRVVTEAIEAECAHRGWKLLAVNVRTNHVHVVVVWPGDSPEHMMQLLKSWATRRLRAEGVFGPGTDDLDAAREHAVFVDGREGGGEGAVRA
jgi:REP element-mobilizing transposase RayT